MESVIEWSHNLFRAELAAADGKEKTAAAHEAHIKRIKYVEDASQARYDAGRENFVDLLYTRYHRLSAEIELAKLKSK